MASEAQKRANKKYRKSLYQMNIVFYPSESDLVSHIESKDNKTKYIKDLIKKDMGKANS